MVKPLDFRVLKESGRLAIADGTGQVTFTSLSEGAYYIRLELTGFLTQTIGPVTIGDHCVRLPQLKVTLQS
jgi:hypothetical protein